MPHTQSNRRPKKRMKDHAAREKYPLRPHNNNLEHEGRKWRSLPGHIKEHLQKGNHTDQHDWDAGSPDERLDTLARARLIR